jgi:uncharacterized protein YndB with AHSA1/START domain
MTPEATPIQQRELVLTRLLDAPRRNLYRCWTETELLKQWFTPAPWSTPFAELDPRTGGSSYIVMADPDGNEYPNRGVFLEVVENERIVMTDAFAKAWEPSGKAFMVATITFADEDGKTRYTATVQHWSVEDRQQHEQMGFHQGWGLCAEQLEKLARSL